MAKIVKFISFFFIGFLLCGCTPQSNSLKPTAQSREWNALFDSKEWRPINNEQTIESFDKTAM